MVLFLDAWYLCTRPSGGPGERAFRVELRAWPQAAAGRQPGTARVIRGLAGMGARPNLAGT